VSNRSRNLPAAIVVAILPVVCGIPMAQAHHSAAMFDRSKQVTLAGTVKEYQFKNPHVWIELMVPGKGGKPVQWSVEGEGPSMMARMGLSPKTLKSGDHITLRAHPLRDGRSGGSFIEVKLADGKTIGSSFGPPRAIPKPASKTSP
jgi:Family of unknown function (DUF6152)